MICPDFTPIRETLEAMGGAMPTAEQLMERAGINAAELEALCVKGFLMRTRSGKYCEPSRQGCRAGLLQIIRSGAGFVNLREDEDIYVAAEEIGSALDGDRVLVQIITAGDRRPEGRIIRVLERAHARVVGLFGEDGQGCFVSPDDPKLDFDILIDSAHRGEAQPGDAVFVEMLEFPDAEREARGRVLEVLGQAGDAGVDILSIARAHGWSDAFPPEALAEAEAIGEAAPLEAYPECLDLRETVVLTIDGADAKDLDDALSCEKTERGWKLGVHIADVSRRVTPGSALDEEAGERTTSVYLINRVLPMLPPAISNGVCSLLPGTDKCALSCMMELDENAEVVRYTLAETLISSHARLTYDRADALLAGKDGGEDLRPGVMETLLQLDAVSKRRLETRRARGAVIMEIPEPYIELDKEGHPTAVRAAPTGGTHSLIEECMLLANETIAEWAGEERMPVLFRVHEAPDMEKMRDMDDFVQAFGYRLRGLGGNTIQPGWLQALLRDAEGKPEQGIIARVLLRSMQKAKYWDRDEGHFGLAARHYCHFTSPIRRYPDLIVHRAVKAWLRGEGDKWRKECGDLRALGLYCTEQEVSAMQTEREVDDLKTTEYMTDHVGEDFYGLISGVTEFGFFVELPNTVEGLVHITTLPGDQYRFDEKRFALVGRGKKDTYRIGDPVRVRIARTDISARKVDMVLSPER